jgi:hypothetical protein
VTLFFTRWQTGPSAVCVTGRLSGLPEGELAAGQLRTMKTLKEIIIERKCRKGAAAGTTKRGAYWLACEPIITREAGGDGIGQNAPDITDSIELRHFRDDNVRAVIHRDAWHQNGAHGGAGDGWMDASGVLNCSTIEEVLVVLKGTALAESPVVNQYSADKTLIPALRELGLPDAAPGPDEV